MTIVMWIRVHPYKATHFENRKSILPYPYTEVLNWCSVFLINIL